MKWAVPIVVCVLAGLAQAGAARDVRLDGHRLTVVMRGSSKELSLYLENRDDPDWKAIARWTLGQ